jgi:hypothetical protein
VLDPTARRSRRVWRIYRYRCTARVWRCPNSYNLILSPIRSYFYHLWGDGHRVLRHAFDCPIGECAGIVHLVVKQLGHLDCRSGSSVNDFRSITSTNIDFMQIQDVK